MQKSKQELKKYLKFYPENDVKIVDHFRIQTASFTIEQREFGKEFSFRLVFLTKKKLFFEF